MFNCYFLVLFSLLIFGFKFNPAWAQDAEGKDQNSTVSTLQKRESETLMAHKPIYFAYGEPSTKIQFSFRSQLSDALPLNFAYSQIIFWALREDSRPFEDATYNPEIFFRFRSPGRQWSALDVGIWEHTSNGKDGPQSRSYDQFYLRAAYGAGWLKHAAIFGLKVKYIYNLDKTNSDIQEYIGPFDLHVRLVKFLDEFFLDETELIFSVMPGGKFGTEFHRGGYQVSADFHINGINMNPAFYVQYYHGYAETLINYDEKVDEIRVGLTF